MCDCHLEVLAAPHSVDTTKPVAATTPAGFCSSDVLKIKFVTVQFITRNLTEEKSLA